MSEQAALIAFIELLPKGNILRDIAKRRLEDLEGYEITRNQEIMESVCTERIQCFDIRTNETFKSISDAAVALQINGNTLRHDFYKRKYKYGVYPLSFKGREIINTQV